MAVRGSRRLHMLAQYQGKEYTFLQLLLISDQRTSEICLFSLRSTEAVQWLEAAAEECHKTQNVDLQMLITNCQHCSLTVRELVVQETHPTRLAALEQLLLTLAHHRRVLVAKKRELECASLPPTIGTMGKVEECSQGGEDKQTRSRLQAIESTILQSSGVWFDGVAGLEAAKQALREAIILPLRYPQLFTGGRQPWRRILLYGPPGTGKTRLAQAVSGEVDSIFYCVSSSDLISSWIGESEKIVRDLFQHARRSRGNSVIFIDEIDSVCRQRTSREEEHTRRVKTELLRQMEGADSGTENGELFLLCATNCPWELDPAFLRRFQRRIFIPLPCRQARRRLLELHLGGSHVELSEADWEGLVTRTEGLSGSDIATVVADALLQPVRELEGTTHWKPIPGGGFTPCAASDPGALRQSLSELPPQQVCPREVRVADFLLALEHAHCTVGEADLAMYHQFTHQLGQTG